VNCFWGKTGKKNRGGDCAVGAIIDGWMDDDVVPCVKRTAFWKNKNENQGP
jgi:hypothetical protein